MSPLSFPPTLLTLSCLLRPVLDGQNQQTTNDFPLLKPPRSPNENALLPQLKRPWAHTALHPMPAWTWALEDTHLQHCCRPHFNSAETVTPKAQCQSQDRRSHLCLGSQLLTPQLSALPGWCSEPQFRCSFKLRCARPPGQLRGSVSQAGVNLLAAVGPNAQLHLEPPGEQMPGCVRSGLLSVSPSLTPTLSLSWSPQVRPRSPRQPALARVPPSL